MPKFRKKRKSPKRVLALPDLEQAKSAVLNALTSKSGQRTYDHAITRSRNSWSGTALSRDWRLTELSFCVTGSVSNREDTRRQRLIVG
jgi:hypothetical protein